MRPSLGTLSMEATKMLRGLDLCPRRGRYKDDEPGPGALS